MYMYSEAHLTTDSRDKHVPWRGSGILAPIDVTQHWSVDG